ncbi:hypothetical protein ACKWTF_007853 [Chironomus riparius]
MIPMLMIKGPYKVNGIISFLPLNGRGESELVLDNVHFVMKFKTKMYDKNGNAHLKLEKSKMNFNTTRLRMNFVDLFGSNEQLGLNMNTFLNENWKEILEDLKMTIVDGFGEVFSTIINHVLNNFAYKELFN